MDSRWAEEPEFSGTDVKFEEVEVESLVEESLKKWWVAEGDYMLVVEEDCFAKRMAVALS